MYETPLPKMIYFAAIQKLDGVVGLHMTTHNNACTFFCLFFFLLSVEFALMCGKPIVLLFAFFTQLTNINQMTTHSCSHWYVPLELSQSSYLQNQVLIPIMVVYSVEQVWGHVLEVEVSSTSNYLMLLRVSIFSDMELLHSSVLQTLLSLLPPKKSSISVN